MTIRDDVLKTADVMADNPSANENTIVERLVALGYDHLRAELLVAFVPLGLARAVIARIPAASPIHLSNKALIQSPNGPLMEISLASVPEFQIAREMGEETFNTGIVPRNQLAAASRISVELILVNDALNAETTISRIAPPILLRLAEAPGFEQWYRGLRRRIFHNG